MMAFEALWYAVIDPDTGQVYDLPQSGYFIHSYAEAVWGPQGIWVSARGGYKSFLYLAQMLDGEDPLLVSYVLPDAGDLGLRLGFPLPLPGGGLGFYHYCASERETGIYELGADGKVEFLAPLAPGCCSLSVSPERWVPPPEECWVGSVLWPAGGSAFLYLLDGRDPGILGLTGDGTLWDVRQALSGAERFRWGLSLEESPGPTLQAEIEATLLAYTQVRQRAEETLDPDLLDQVCVDPYLAWKQERIQDNADQGSHWETWAVDWHVTALTPRAEDEVEVGVRKTETKVFFPPGSDLPDDEICADTIYSYRDCTYDAVYTMVRREGRWYVSEARAEGECPAVCQRPTPTATPGR